MNIVGDAVEQLEPKFCVHVERDFERIVILDENNVTDDSWAPFHGVEEELCGYMSFTFSRWVFQAFDETWESQPSTILATLCPRPILFEIVGWVADWLQ